MAGLAAVLVLPARAVDLLERYPTTLSSGVLSPGDAKPWEFTAEDVFSLSRFSFEVGDQLKVETGPAMLGIGHCSEGAVWAIVLPADPGKVTWPGATEPEQVAHVWLRFHPKEINRLFAPGTVSAGEGEKVLQQMRQIAGAKFRSSYHAGMNAMIPQPQAMTVDVDTKAGRRRFFMVDTEAKTAQYVAAFERQAVRAGAGGAPKIVASSPADGARDVDPELTEVTVTFDQDMDKGGYSWTGGPPQMPKGRPGERAHWESKRTCVLPVTLEPGHHYRVGINAPSFHNFRNAAGEPVIPTAINFTTR